MFEQRNNFLAMGRLELRNDIQYLYNQKMDMVMSDKSDNFQYMKQKQEAKKFEKIVI
jgi:hypothetical protein